MPKNVTVTLTEKQAHLLTSLMSDLAAQVQYRYMKMGHTTQADALDRTHEVWQQIALQIAEPIGRQNEILSAQTPKGSEHIDLLMKIVRREA
jgi:hypothetical protein